MREFPPLPERCEPFTDTRETVARLLRDACARLPENEIGHAAPSIDVIRALLERATTTRLTRAQRANRDAAQQWRTLAAPRRRDDIGRTFIHRLHWHGGRGSATLHSTMFSVWDIGRAAFEIIDTVAAVFAYLFFRDGLTASHSGRWANALWGSGTWNAAQRFRRGYESGHAARAGRPDAAL